jgi:hypothetical protein
MAKKKFWIPQDQKSKNNLIDNLRLYINMIIQSDGEYLKPKSLRKILQIEKKISKLT